MKNKINSKLRIEFIDSLKGFAIFCVLWGHSIQYCRGELYDFLHDPLFEFIYSFHMPLFFMISGFFFASSLKLSFKDFFVKKVLQLLLPCLTWAVIYLIFRVIFSFFFNTPIAYKEELLSVILPIKWPFWFLKELFISYVLVYVSLKVLKRRWIACVLTIVFVLIAPYGVYQRFLLPVFWCGYFMSQYYSYIEKHSRQLLYLFLGLFAICLAFWDGNYTIYISGFPRLYHVIDGVFNINNWNISLFRLFIGLCGSFFLFLLFKQVYKKNIVFSTLEKIGVYTLAIYIFHSFIPENILVYLNLSFIQPLILYWIITFVLSIFILVFCVLIFKLISKNNTLNLLLFGNSYQSRLISDHKL